MGTSVVPTFIFDRSSGPPGAYPAQTLAQAIRQAAIELVRVKSRRVSSSMP